mmetsp:Transcript_91153/g.294533  ORF Transcript_91153/g.294533 Transcript_91153/m.294533 type:complete len:631 (-) Transcript_91153:43-1935(-)
MGNGAGCGTSAAKVAPSSCVHQMHIDVTRLVCATKRGNFPATSSTAPVGEKDAERCAGPAAGGLGDCLLFLEQIQHTRGRLSVRASVSTLPPSGDQPRPVAQEPPLVAAASPQPPTHPPSPKRPPPPPPEEAEPAAGAEVPKGLDEERTSEGATPSAGDVGTDVAEELPGAAPSSGTLDSSDSAAATTSSATASTAAATATTSAAAAASADAGGGGGESPATPKRSTHSMDSDEGSPLDVGYGSDGDFCIPGGAGESWPLKCCVGKASWYSAKSLCVPFQERRRYVLTLQVWDGKNLLATLEEPLGDLPVHAPISRELPLASGRKPDKVQVQPSSGLSVSFQILSAEAIAHKRTVFFVRHAESVWNVAQSKAQVHKMVSETDHGLSAAGGRQAEKLAERLAEAAKGRPEARADAAEDHAVAAELLRPDVVYVSPLTRAVQTAVISLGPTLVQHGGLGEVVLMPNAREKHNLGGMDTVSTKTGVSILHGVLKKLRDLSRDAKDGDATDAPETFGRLRFDIAATEEQWWSEGRSEPKAQVQLRMREFMSQLLYSPHRSIVVVGHSLFFKAVMKCYLNEEFKTKQPDFAERVSKMKLMNCGILRLELDPQRGLDGNPIMDARLVLGSELIKSK